MAAILVLAGLCAVVALHELAHWAAARAAGLRVTDVSLGLGPAIFRRAGARTTFRVGLIPFGGYVRVAELAPGEAEPGRFAAGPILARLAAIGAGPISGFLLAAGLVTAAAWTGGIDTGRIAGLDTMDADGPAADAGLRSGDRIVAVEGEPLVSIAVLSAALRGAEGPVSLTVRRGTDEPIVLSIVPDRSGDRPRLGGRYRVRPERREAGLAEALVEGLRWSWTRAGGMLDRAADWIRMGAEARPVGPTGLADRVSRVERWDAPRVLRLGALLALAVALFNLLPLPGLDGGRLVIEGIESARRRRLPRGAAAAIQVFGTLVLLGAWVAVTVVDLAG
jgi:regulator of sigma E protease